MRITALLVGGVGGVLVDFDHFLSTITNGQIEWDFLHNHVFFLGCFVALLGGLLITLVLSKCGDS